jgi:hypothetical protein
MPSVRRVAEAWKTVLFLGKTLARKFNREFLRQNNHPVNPRIRKLMKDLSIKMPVRILCLEDNPLDQELLQTTLTDDGLTCEFVPVQTKTDFEAALERGPFDLIISDFGLPSYSGLAALSTARKVQSGTPFIFVSGTIGEERAIESLKNGATDYVLKDRRERLAPAVRRALREAQERTEHQEATEQARIQATALESSANGILITDPQGRILSANKAFCATAGRPLEDLLGRTPDFLTFGQHDPGFHEELWKAILSGQVWRGEAAIKRKDGNCCDLEMTITPVQGSKGGAISHFIAVSQDVTERKHLEEQLRQSQKMEAIGQLAGGVAHDFNNLLAVIQGNAEMALMDVNAANGQIRENLSQITEASARAANLTRQLLAFGRKQAMRPQPISLNNVITDLTKMLNRIIGEDIQLQCTCDKRPVYVHADAGMMEQVLLNLVINARDAMPHGGRLHITTKRVRVDRRYVRAHPEAHTGDYACLKVRDTGSGISPEHLPRIFEPFFTTKEVGKGTGLGLATVYGIVKQHHGWIDVISRVNSGTEFRMFLPAIQPPVKTLKPTGVETVVRGGAEKILVVEDDPSVRLLARRILGSFGYQVIEASSGREALEIWRKQRAGIDLLLTDMVMPDGLTGSELAEELRREAPALKVVFMSGYSMNIPGKDTVYIEQRDHFFLQKPFPTQVFVDTIRHCLDGVRTPSH